MEASRRKHRATKKALPINRRKAVSHRLPWWLRNAIEVQNKHIREVYADRKFGTSEGRGS